MTTTQELIERLRNPKCKSYDFGGTGYAVFVLNHSGWWFALAIAARFSAYSPAKWIHGRDV